MNTPYTCVQKVDSEHSLYMRTEGVQLTFLIHVYRRCTVNIPYTCVQKVDSEHSLYMRTEGGQ